MSVPTVVVRATDSVFERCYTHSLGSLLIKVLFRRWLVQKLAWKRCSLLTSIIVEVTRTDGTTLRNETGIRLSDVFMAQHLKLLWCISRDNIRGDSTERKWTCEPYN